MSIIDFRLRPPVRGFLDTPMYPAGERRDGFTPSPSRFIGAASIDLMGGSARQLLGLAG